MNSTLTKRASTLFLKAVLVVIAVIVTTACAFLFPQLWVMVLREMPEFPRASYMALVGVFASLLPFLFALYQAFKLLHYIDKNNAFSDLSVNALRKITFSAVAMSFLYAMAIPLLFIIAELDDAPGLGAIALAITGAPLVVATFAAVLQKLVQNAVDIKTENDLTI